MFPYDCLAAIWNRVEVSMLKFISNIKEKYNLKQAISNLGFFTMFVFLFIAIETDEFWENVLIKTNEKISETKEITNFTQAVRGCKQ